jgi:hypothetical protein
MRRTPPAPTSSSPWAETILPAAAPRRPSRFSRSEKPPVEAPDTPAADDPDAPPPADQLPAYATSAASAVMPEPYAAPAAPFAPPPAFAPAAPPNSFAPPAPFTQPAPFTPSAPAAAVAGFGQVDRFGIPIAPPPAPGYAPTGYAPGGYPPAGYAQGGYPPGPPGQWTPPPPANNWPVALKVGIAVVVVAIGAAVAIPVFITQQKPANRPVALPATLLGEPQLHNDALDGASNAVLNQVNLADAPWTDPQVAYYGQDTIPEFAVVAAKMTRRASPQDETSLFRGVSAEVTLTPEGSGPYGGKMECGPVTNQGIRGVICASIDSGAFVETVMFGSATNSEVALLSRQIISAVEGGPSLGSIGTSTL